MKIFKHNKIDRVHVVVLFPTRNRILINVQVPGNINQNDCFLHQNESNETVTRGTS